MERSEATISHGARKPRPALSKSLLYGTSALAGVGLVAGGSGGAGAQEQRIELGVGGFVNNFYGFTSIDEADAEDADFNEFTSHFDGEIQFSGKTVLENGLEVGAQIELEVPTVGDQIDEAYMWVEGAFGLFTLGGDNTAMYRMGLGTFGAGGVGVPINSGWISDFVPETPGFAVSFRSPSVSTAIDVHNDDNAITYFTPRTAGFQLGASYVPFANFDGSPTNGPADLDGETYANGWSVGANWVGEFQGFELGVSGGFAQAFAGDGIEAAGGDDIKQVMAGFVLGFGGLSLEGSYANEIDGRIASGAGGGGGRQIVPALVGAMGPDDDGSRRQSTEGWSAIGGLTYTLGPWSFSGSYMHSEVEGLLARFADGQDELDVAQGSIGYALGPGISVSGGVLYAEWDDELNGVQDGVSVFSGFKLGF